MNASPLVVVGGARSDLLLGVPRLPSWDTEMAASAVVRRAGGKGLNQAIAAAKTGVRTALLATLANDPSGRQLAMSLRSSGVARDLCAHRPGARTPTTVALIDPQGRPAFIEAGRPKNLFLSMEDVEHAAPWLTQAEVVLATFEVPPRILDQLQTIARDAGSTFILNPAPIRGISLRHARRIAAAADVLVPNLSEVAALVGMPKSSKPDELVKRARREYTSVLCVTAGEQGCYLVYGSKVEHYPPERGIVAVDATGASDVFCGVLASELVTGHSIARAVVAANGAAEASTQYFGSLGGLAGHPVSHRTASDVTHR